MHEQGEDEQRETNSEACAHENYHRKKCRPAFSIPLHREVRTQITFDIGFHSNVMEVKEEENSLAYGRVAQQHKLHGQRCSVAENLFSLHTFNPRRFLVLTIIAIYT